MDAIPIREFVKYRPIDILSGYKTNNNIVFEDGVVVENMHYKEVVVTRYMLDVMLMYPELPIMSTYNIANYYTNGIFTSKSINKCFETMLEDIIKKLYIPGNNYSELSEVHRRMYEVVNAIYNDIGYNNVEYSTSSNIIDYLDIQMDDRLIKAIQIVEAKKETGDTTAIDDAYAVLDTLLTKDPKYVNNPIAKAYISGMVNPNQIKQILGPRGYVTEIDGSIFKYPIASSFALGMNNIYEEAVESRSAAKALFLSNIAVQDSEYLARELQLVAMVVERLIKTDCGNTEYINWYVRPSHDGMKSDLHNLVGKRYWNEKTQREEIINNRNIELEGTTIKLRSVLKCKLKDPTHICSACMGDLAYSIQDHSAVGHLCTAATTQKITQSILSTKHLTGSASSNSLKLSEVASKFFNIKEGDGYAFKAGINNKATIKLSLIVTQYEAFGLKDIKTVDDISRLDPTRISRISSFIIAEETKNGIEYYPITIKEGSKYGAFTEKFLEYIVTTGYSLDAQDRYIIDVSKWKYVSPIIKMPQIEYSFLELANEVKNMLKYIKIEADKKSKETPETLLQKLFDLINSKLDVNIGLLDVMVYAFTINSMEHRDYVLGRNNPNQEVADIKHIMPNRSLGGFYAWEYVAQGISSPLSFSDQHRMNHPLDAMLMPNETITEYNGGIIN